MNKGQGSTIDLFASIAIFIVVVALVIYYYTYFSNRVQRDLEYEELQIRAYRIADLLTKTPGDPSRWEALPGNPIDVNKISSLGLAINDRQLSKEKALNLTRIDYNDLKKLLNIEPYEFNITIKTRDDLITLLRKYDIRVAYLGIQTHCADDAIRNELISLYNCKKVGDITDRNLERCEMYDTPPEITSPGPAFGSNFDFFKNISDYDLIVMEDANIKTGNTGARPWYSDGESLENFTKNGGYFLVTRRIATTSRYILGINYTITTIGSDPTLVTTDYYNARDTGDERFILLPGDSSNQANIVTFNPNYVDAPANITNFLSIARNNVGNNSAARWQFGKGVVYYLNDACDATLKDAVGVAAKKITIHLSASLFSNILTSGKNPPKNADIVTVQRDVLFENKTAIIEITMWIP